MKCIENFKTLVNKNYLFLSKVTNSIAKYLFKYGVFFVFLLILGSLYTTKYFLNMDKKSDVISKVENVTIDSIIDLEQIIREDSYQPWKDYLENNKSKVDFSIQKDIITTSLSENSNNGNFNNYSFKNQNNINNYKRKKIISSPYQNPKVYYPPKKYNSRYNRDTMYSPSKKYKSNPYKSKVYYQKPKAKIYSKNNNQSCMMSKNCQ